MAIRAPGANLRDTAAGVEGARVVHVQRPRGEILGAAAHGRAAVAGVERADFVVVGRPGGERAAARGDGGGAGRELHVAGVGGGGAADGRAGVNLDRAAPHVDRVVGRGVARIDVRLRRGVENGHGKRSCEVLRCRRRSSTSRRLLCLAPRRRACRRRPWSRRWSGCWRSCRRAVRAARARLAARRARVVRVGRDGEARRVHRLGVRAVDERLGVGDDDADRDPAARAGEASSRRSS